MSTRHHIGRAKPRETPYSRNDNKPVRIPSPVKQVHRKEKVFNPTTGRFDQMGDITDIIDEEYLSPLPLVQIIRSAGSSRGTSSGGSIYDQFHHTPPNKITFVPYKLQTFGLKLQHLVQQEEDVEIPSLGMLEQQVQFWMDNPLSIEFKTVNSIRSTLVFEPPYEYFDWQDEGPLIGLFKRSGNTEAQAIWMTLPEASILVKLFLYLLELKKKELCVLRSEKRRTKISQEFKLAYTLEPCHYEPANFVGLGVPRDYVIPEVKPNDDLVTYPNCQRLQDTIRKQQTKASAGGNVSYPIGSIELLAATLQRRELFGIIKKLGAHSGQRIWMSIHEAQHVIVNIINHINTAVVELEKQ